ncbi:signal peptidase I [Paenibacillus donghaensis]|uniref:Signal peptidase I n=1 Tax=Paenibacillus donghaensis TaxID=414771 RepID=A0A2Z2K784_9BACL|nr:signal peptidase I [Paenibacillus donghaensis]ASA20824.1 signal peptidase I [Paenibacillus donghaensis]
MKFLKQWVPSIVIGIVISLFVRTYVAEAMRVPTGSMIPTIQINDHLIVEKMLWASSLEHGDIIVFNHKPSVAEERMRLVKRLIGLPGDTVEVKEGVLYRNGAQVDEPYLQLTMDYDFGPVTVPAAHYFFMGDNRNISYDGHLWENKFVSEDELVGKVIAEFSSPF